MSARIPIRGLYVGSLLLLLLSLSGCWDYKNVQDNNYVTAIGIDFQNDKYIVYTQSLDFSNVAKQEGVKPKDKVPVWLGRGEGVTLDAAINNIYNSSQLPIVWEHTTAIVFHERVLSQNMKSMMDSMLRYHEIRYSPWVFGTHVSIKELFAVNNTFNLAPINSLLHNPMDMYEQQAYIKPLSLREMLIKLVEPGATLLLPSLATNSKQWFKDIKPNEQYEVDGIFVIDDNSYKGWQSKADSLGLRWINSSSARTALAIGRDNNKHQVLLSMETSKWDIHVRTQGAVLSYAIKANITGSIDEMLAPLPESEIEELAEDKVKAEIKHTFKVGLDHNADLYSLHQYVYRQQVTHWKRQGNGRNITLSPGDLDNIQVKVKLVHAGMSKLKQK
ncbi:Ger(x)C family spore germination protein [Paenibacillus sp. UMB4589-SE434]|uniref:Ger(x)C family spore germination protein n=1 Tax=Paenibacillus sp. UMB4589-SE434 TaxID=3046314 RepID=UPI002551065D|nr:Ger(x)C family spore germination protein [Paenibacillus sp. UMB4589-SE434]MDK8180016.1 Ger(x)C family spore germination protein [Paenibacillus sp. UMB4589-SE434]